MDFPRTFTPTRATTLRTFTPQESSAKNSTCCGRVGASEADPDLGFMARSLALCSLPRSNPGNRHQSPLQLSASVVVA